MFSEFKFLPGRSLWLIICLNSVVQMFVRELSPGSTIGDLVSVKKSDMDSLAANSKSADQKEMRVKVNHQFVDDL